MLKMLGLVLLAVFAGACTGASPSHLSRCSSVLGVVPSSLAFCPPLSRFEGKALLFWPQRSWDRRKAVFSTETGPFNAGRREAVGGWGAVNSRHALPLSMVSGVSKSARFSVAGIKSLAGISWKVKRGNLWDSVVPIVNPEKLVLYIVFQIVYARALRLLYQVQIQVWRLVRKHDPPPYSESVLGFLEPRLHMLSRVLALVYLLNGAVGIMIASGWNIQPSLAKVMSDVIYCWYMGYFIDKAKQFTLPVWIPSLRADKRKGFIYNRSLSVFTWSVCALYVVEIISVFLRIPITSTLAFGGIGGLAFGLAGKDVLSNFFGGLMLLLAEPFIPGDMVTFQRNGVRCEGRVERVGWYQTRLRGRDTRPTYVPNSVFVDSMVTNMDRITHRKFETNFELRYDDLPKVTAIVQGIRAALKEVPNIDLLSPFRVHLVDFSPSGLKFTVVCYFATKSFDEFLYLQQRALLEVARVADEAGATMMSVYHLDMSNPTQPADFEVMKHRIHNGGVSVLKSFENDERGGIAGGEEGRRARMTGGEEGQRGGVKGTEEARIGGINGAEGEEGMRSGVTGGEEGRQSPPITKWYPQSTGSPQGGAL